MQDSAHAIVISYGEQLLNMVPQETMLYFYIPVGKWFKTHWLVFNF